MPQQRPNMKKRGASSGGGRNAKVLKVDVEPKSTKTRREARSALAGDSRSSVEKPFPSQDRSPAPSSPALAVGTRSASLVSPEARGNQRSGSEKVHQPSSDKRNEEVRAHLRQQFGLEVQETDFFDFYDFCALLNPSNPLMPLQCITGRVDLELVGPFELFAAKEIKDAATAYRFFYDIPEVVTVMIQKPRSPTEKGQKAFEQHALHMGVFRDAPAEAYCAVVSNNPAAGSVFTFEGPTLFTAFRKFLSTWVLKPSKGLGKRKSLGAKQAGDEPVRELVEEPEQTKGDIQHPPKATLGESARGGRVPASDINGVLDVLESFCKQRNILLPTVAEADNFWKQRSKKVVAKDFTGLGVLVPYNKTSEVGYRSLPYNQKQLRELLTRCKAPSKQAETSKSEVYDLLNFVNIANDESDFGSALQLGRCLFCADRPEDASQMFTKLAKLCLCTVYRLLDRDYFTEVLEEHVRCKRAPSRVSDQAS